MLCMEVKQAEIGRTKYKIYQKLLDLHAFLWNIPLPFWFTIVYGKLINLCSHSQPYTTHIRSSLPVPRVCWESLCEPIPLFRLLQFYPSIVSESQAKQQHKNADTWKNALIRIYLIIIVLFHFFDSIQTLDNNLPKMGCEDSVFSWS